MSNRLPCVLYIQYLSRSCGVFLFKQGYAVTYSCLLVLLIINELTIVCFSLMGTVAREGPRRYLGWGFLLKDIIHLIDYGEVV